MVMGANEGCRHCGATEGCVCTEPNAEGLSFVTGVGTCWTPPAGYVAPVWVQVKS